MDGTQVVDTQNGMAITSEELESALRQRREMQRSALSSHAVKEKPQLTLIEEELAKRAARLETNNEATSKKSELLPSTVEDEIQPTPEEEQSTLEEAFANVCTSAAMDVVTRKLFSESKSEPARKYDAGKPRWDLLPPDAMHELVMLYTAGAAKYGERNWEKGMTWGRVFRAMMTHAWRFWWGQRHDDDQTGSRQHHMASVAWCALTLMAYDLRGAGKDDRPVLPNRPV